jgi:hypothetical protein
LSVFRKKFSRLRLSALALWNFASGEPAKGRIPQGESAVKFLLLPNGQLNFSISVNQLILIISTFYGLPLAAFS